MASDEERHYPEDPTAVNSSQGADHSASASPGGTVATLQRLPITSTYHTDRSEEFRGTSAVRASTIPTTLNRLDSDEPHVGNDARNELPKRTSPVPPLPKVFDVSTLESSGRRVNIISDVNEHTEDDALSSSLNNEARNSDMRTDARTIAETIGDSTDRHRSKSEDDEPIDFRPSQTRGGIKSKSSFDRSTADHKVDPTTERGRLRRVRSQANTSYQDHTQASIARQTEKVELAPTRRNSHGTLREPPSRIMTPRSNFALSSRRSSPRPFTSGKDGSRPASRPPSNVTTPGGRKNKSGVNNAPRTPNQDAHSGPQWLTESPTECASLHNGTEDLEAHGRIVHDKLEQLQQQARRNETERGAPNDDEGHLVARGARNQRDESLGVTLSQHSLGLATTERGSAELSRSESEALQRRIAELEQQLESQSKELQEVTRVVQNTSRASVGGIPETDVLQSLTPESFSNEETATLHACLSELLSQLSSKMQSLLHKNVDLQQQLTNTGHELSIASRALKDEPFDTSIMEPVEKSEWDKYTWKQAYKDMRRRKEQVEERFESFKKIAEEMYQPDLEKKNRELQEGLNDAQDEVDKLREKVTKYQSRAQHWEMEYKTAVVERNKRTVEFETAVKKQTEETLLYIKEYHDKTHNPEHWEMVGLQKRIRVLERDLQTTNALFNTTKTDKARLEDEFKKLINANNCLEGEIERLGQAFVFGGNVAIYSAPEPDPSNASSSSSTSSSPHSFIVAQKVPRRGPYTPRFAVVDKRNAARAKLRQAQELRMADEKKKMEILEKVRRWRMEKAERMTKKMAEEADKRKSLRIGKTHAPVEAYPPRKAMPPKTMYPPNKEGWRDLNKQRIWERWDGDEWLEEGSSEKDRDVVWELREKGLL